VERGTSIPCTFTRYSSGSHPRVSIRYDQVFGSPRSPARTATTPALPETATGSLFLVGPNETGVTSTRIWFPGERIVVPLRWIRSPARKTPCGRKGYVWFGGWEGSFGLPASAPPSMTRGVGAAEKVAVGGTSPCGPPAMRQPPQADARTAMMRTHASLSRVCMIMRVQGSVKNLRGDGRGPRWAGTIANRCALAIPIRPRHT